MKKCLSCGKELTRKDQKKFCSRSCAASTNNVLHPKRRRIGIQYSCLFCGEHVVGWRKTSSDNSYSNHYCSISCSVNHRSKIRFENGEASPPTIRRNLIAMHGNKCSICGITEWMGKPVPVIADHIDGNSDNNFPSNLRLVCPNCDAQLPTYKGGNKGNGRLKRRQHYRKVGELK